jgi:hypothetical protein
MAAIGTTAFVDAVPAEAARRPGRWLRSPGWDVSVFGGSAALAALLLVWGQWTDVLAGITPTWAWIATVVGVDVAHVWSTAYRVYLDPVELRRRPALYLGTPVAAYLAGVLLYTSSGALFWRVLAYTAVIHFVRQQYGWMALYRRRLGEVSRLDRLLDDAAIYSATLYPLVYWHAHLPREFAWFLDGDFLPGLPASAADALFPVHVAISVAYVARQGMLMAQGRPVSWGKNLIVATTWLAWYGGIVILGSDNAITVTNVLVHGIPYLAVVWLYGHNRYATRTNVVAQAFRKGRWWVFLTPLIVIAWLEEWGWDLLVWHDHGALFPGPALAPGPELLALLVPLLALPQATHYVLDAWIWRTRGNPGLAEALR